MRVLVLVPSFRRVSPIKGIMGFALYLHRQGHEVVFGALDGTERVGDLRENLSEHSIPYVGFGTMGWTGLLRGAQGVQRHVSREAIDVVISALVRPDLVNARLKGVLRVASARIITSDGLRPSHGPLIADAAQFVHCRALRRMDGVFTMTEEMTAYLRAGGVEAAALWQVHNFVDVKEVRKRARLQVQSAADRVELGTFGRLIKRKRVDLSIRALAVLKETLGLARVRLHVVGDGPLSSELVDLAGNLGLHEEVVFHGHLSEPLDLMGRMDLVVLSSESEGTPRVVMEALALGKTCVVPDMGSVKPLIIEGITGYTFDPGDSGSLASTLRRIITSEQYLPSGALVDFMLDEFDVDVCGRKMVERIRHAWIELDGGADTGTPTT